jgi:hypothetical protein
MYRPLRKHKFLFAWISAAFATLTVSACYQDGFVQNPFVPRAELRILDVNSSEEGRFVGIRQSSQQEGLNTFIVYTYAEPIVRIEARAGFPVVNFKRFTSRVTLSDGTVIPTKEYPLSIGMLSSATDATIISEVRFPILSADRDIQNVVYPGNNAPRVLDGRAEIVLYGRDANGYDVQIPLSVPLAFESLVFSNSPVPATLAPTVSPSPQTSATPGGQ